MLKIKLKEEGGLFPPPFSKGTGWAVITVLQFSSQTLLRPKSILAGHHLLICDTFYSKWNVILSLVNDCNKSMGKENRTTENSNSKFPPVVRAVLIAFVTFSKKKKKQRGKKMVLLKDWLLFVEMFISLSDLFKLFVNSLQLIFTILQKITVPCPFPRRLEQSLIKWFYTGSPLKS